MILIAVLADRLLIDRAEGRLDQNAPRALIFRVRDEIRSRRVF